MRFDDLTSLQNQGRRNAVREALPAHVKGEFGGHCHGEARAILEDRTRRYLLEEGGRRGNLSDGWQPEVALVYKFDGRIYGAIIAFSNAL